MRPSKLRGPLMVATIGAKSTTLLPKLAMSWHEVSVSIRSENWRHDAFC